MSILHQDPLLPDLQQLLKYKGINKSHPILISIDCDRTIIDRNRGSHCINESFIEVLHSRLKDERFIFVFNTGRDITNFSPIQKSIKYMFPCLYVGGRVLQNKGQLITDPKAILPSFFIQALVKAMKAKKIPFLDIKHRLGNTFVIVENAKSDHLIGHHRPKDWYDSINIDIKRCTLESIEKVISDIEDIVRIEIPLVCSMAAHLIASRTKNINVRKKFSDFLNIDLPEQIMTIPVHTHMSRAELMEDIVSIRVMNSNKIVNKGTGLQWIQNLYSIPNTNVVMIGDSADPTANDIIVKQVIPEATILVPSDAKSDAMTFADLIIPSVDQDGVARMIQMLAICL